MTQCCMGQDCPSVLLYMMHIIIIILIIIIIYRCIGLGCISVLVCVINVRTYVVKLQLHNCMGTLDGRTVQSTVIH